LEPLFGIPLREELLSFDHGKLYGASAFLDGKDNFERMKGALNERFGPPAFTNPRISHWKWKWQGSSVEIQLMYDERPTRTWVNFEDKKY
jgi:hypothetical protein